jgi:hypothetical protein
MPRQRNDKQRKKRSPNLEPETEEKKADKERIGYDRERSEIQTDMWLMIDCLITHMEHH